MPSKHDTGPFRRDQLGYIWRLIGRQKCAVERVQAAANPAAAAEHIARVNAIGIEIKRLLRTGNILAKIKVRDGVPVFKAPTNNDNNGAPSAP